MSLLTVKDFGNFCEKIPAFHSDKRYIIFSGKSRYF